MTITLNGTNGITTPEVVLDNTAADGGQVVLKSSGYSNWNLDNYSGRLRAYYGGTEYFTVNSSGNVGIGTSSPAGAVNPNARVLNIYSSNTTTNPPELRLSGNAGSSISIAGGASASYVWEYYNVPMTFGTNNTERMRIDSSGKIYANTTDTAAQDGQLNVKVTVAGAQSIDLWNSATSGTRYHMKFRDNTTATVRGSITSDGTNTAFNTSSDYRLKENIKDLPNALETVNQLQPRQFNWKETGKKTTGFIAHELQAVVPDCVTGEKDAVDEEGKPVYQGIDTSFLVATLTKAIQEQQEQIEQMKQEIAALKGAA